MILVMQEWGAIMTQDRQRSVRIAAQLPFASEADAASFTSKAFSVLSRLAIIRAMTCGSICAVAPSDP